MCKAKQKEAIRFFHRTIFINSAAKFLPSYCLFTLYKRKMLFSLVYEEKTLQQYFIIL
jgi:hypothetical protein